MKLEKECWCLLLLPFISCPPALPQAVTVAGDGNNGSANISLTVEQEAVAPLNLATGGEAPSPPPQTPGPQKPYGWHIAIYPVLAWAPVFGVSVTLPSLPSQPIATPGPSGSASSSLNGAYFGGTRLEKGKWSGADFEILGDRDCFLSDRRGEDTGDDDVFVSFQDIGGAVSVDLADCIG